MWTTGGEVVGSENEGWPIGLELQGGSDEVWTECRDPHPPPRGPKTTSHQGSVEQSRRS